MNFTDFIFLFRTAKGCRFYRYALSLVVVFHFLIVADSYSQSAEPKITNLKNGLPALSGKEHVDTLLKLARIYREIDTDSLFKYSREAYSQSKKINYSGGLANSILLVGIGHHDMRKVLEARECYFLALHLFEKLDDKKGMANVLNSLGNSYMEYGDFKMAIEQHSEALFLRKQLPDKQALANSYNNLGNAYAGQTNFHRALDNHLKGLTIKEEINDTSRSGLNVLAMSSLNIGRLYLTIEDYNRADEYLEKAKTLYEQIDNKGGLVLAYGTIAGKYDKQKNYDKAIDAFERAIKISKQIGDEGGELADNYMRIGYTYYKRALRADSTGQKKQKDRDYEIAFNYANLSLELSKKLNYELCVISNYLLMGDIYMQWGEYEKALKSFNKTREYQNPVSTEIAFYEGLYHLKLKQKDYKSALENYTIYTHLNDSVFNIQNTLKSSQLGNAYEEEKKEKVRELKEFAHKEEIKRQRVIQLFILIGLFLVIVFAAIVYRSYRQKRKANIIITKQKSEVEQAYKIIEEQKKIVDEHNKDITDSINYARRIQTALLASDNLLRKNLPEYFVLYKPKDIVSGDFYWASEITDAGTKKFILCTGDCTGHGVPGAFMSLLNITKLNETINEKKIVRPDLVLNAVRDEIIKALNPENSTEECSDGMDCTFCSIELNKDSDIEEKNAGRLSYAAANNPFYLIRNSQLIVGKADKIPVGKSLKEKEPFTFYNIDLQKGDTLYLLTDGYADQFGGGSGKKFKYKQLEELLLSFQPETMEVQKKILNLSIEKWKGSAEQVDDILILGIRI